MGERSGETLLAGAETNHLAFTRFSLSLCQPSGLHVAKTSRRLMRGPASRDRLSLWYQDHRGQWDRASACLYCVRCRGASDSVAAAVTTTCKSAGVSSCCKKVGTVCVESDKCNVLYIFASPGRRRGPWSVCRIHKCLAGFTLSSHLLIGALK